MNRLILLLVFIVIAIAPANSQEPDTVWTKNLSPRKVYDAKFSPDGTMIAHGAGSWLHLRNSFNGEIIREYFGLNNDEVRTVAFSPDSKYLFSGGGRDPLNSEVPFVKMWDIENGGIVKTFYTDEGMDRTAVTSIDISKDGRYLAAVIDSRKMVNGSRDLALFIWDINMNDMPQIKKLCIGDRPKHVEFCPNGNLLAVTTGNHVSIYDSNEFTFISKLGKEEDYHSTGLSIQDLSFSPDGSRIATVAEDGYAKIWDVENRSLEKSILIELVNDYIATVAFNSTGEFIATGGGLYIKTMIWNIEKELKIYSYNDDSGSATGLDVNWSNDQIISSSKSILRLFNGRFNTSAAGEEQKLIKNLYPNPTNNIVTITYYNPSSSFTQIEISDITGIELEMIFSGFVESGSQEIQYDASNISAGIYFINIQSPSFSKTLKLIKQ